MSKIKCFMVEKTGRGHEWVRPDTGEKFLSQEKLPAGAMWFAPWYKDLGPRYNAPDGTCLVVNTPAGAWTIDSKSSNCGRPDDDVHKCWVRHGVAPEITVDKNGNTCSAGAGSIMQSIAGGHKANYHGFLRNGYLEECC